MGNTKKCPKQTNKKTQRKKERMKKEKYLPPRMVVKIQ